MELLPLVLLGSSKGVEDKVAGVTRATRLGVVWEAQYPGTLADAAVTKGVAAITVETGGQGRLDNAALGTMKGAILGVLEHMGIVKHHDGQADTPQVRVRGNFVKAEMGGFFETLVALGDDVDKAQPIGRFVDAFGTEIASIGAPHAGLVCAVRTTPPVLPGGELVLVGEVISRG
jgi:predicted deacylase